MRPFRVVVTGSECTGKTTLARDVARHFDAPWSEEAVRSFVAAEGRVPEARDVLAIARAQVEAEEHAVDAAGALVVHDTDLLSTIVYSRHYFGACPAGVESEAADRLPSLYVLAGTDVVWAADGDQRDRPFARREIQALFRVAVIASGARRIEVAGPPHERVGQVLAAIARVRRNARTLRARRESPLQ
ncbi:MAG: AAA family ATPase [Acidobacteria bacterium]|nr:AAA family ATPase [Acidobacteriota bacterium]